MDNENKMGSLSFSNTEEDEKNEVKVQEALPLTPPPYDFSAPTKPIPTFEITEEERRFVNGNQPRVKVKSHIKRNVFLVLTALIIVGLISAYCFVPIIKSTVNNTVMTSKGYFKWAMNNTLSQGLKFNDSLTEKLENTNIVFTSNDENISIYNSKSDFYMDYTPQNKEESFKAYYDREKSQKYMLYPSKSNTWGILDANYDAGIFDTLTSLDINTYYDTENLSLSLKKYLDIYLDNVFNAKREKSAGMYINGKVYDTTKITFSMDGNRYLKFISSLYFEIAKDEDMLKYLYDNKGITREQILELANDYNMIRQGISGSYDATYVFDWYINEVGIITGLSFDWTTTYQNATTNQKTVILFGYSESSVDAEIYVEANSKRLITANLCAKLSQGKYSGTASIVSNEISKQISFEKVELCESEIINGIKGTITADENELIFDYKDGVQYITNGDKNYSLLVKKAAEKFTPPDTTNATYIYSKNDWESSK